MGRTRSITSSDKNAIYAVLNQCYKAGVRDAEYIDDEARCKEFIEATKQPHVYGRVTAPDYFNWKRWKIAIVTMQDREIERDTAITYIGKILTPHNYFACLLPIAQYFYNQGLSDWNSNPTLHNFSKFNGDKQVRWTTKGIEVRTRKNMFVDIQRFAFEIGHIGEASNDKNALKPIHFEWFCRAVWKQTLTRKDKTRL